MIRIIIADDHTLVRAGINALLSSKKDIKVIDQTASGMEAVKLCKKLNPDVALLDLSMPDLDGLDATKMILADNPKIKVLILTMYENEEYASRALNAGASGFIVKSVAPEELPDAIRKVFSGDVYITHSIMKKMVLQKSKRHEDNMLSILSDRELQVFHKLARGVSYGRISEELCMSSSTVASYKSRIMKKLGMENNAELLHYAIRIGLVDKYE